MSNVAAVACVLRSGGVYDEAWVRALYAGVREHWPRGKRLRFTCFSDVPVDVPGVDVVRLAHDWPRWWAKMEMFRPGIFGGPVLGLDLDTLVVGSLASFAEHGQEFAMISDVWEPRHAQSGVLAWTPGGTARAAWDVFVDDAAAIMREFRGDGEFLRTLAEPVVRLQDLFPRQIAGFKVRRPRTIIPRVPDGCSIICAHGDPRFSSSAAGWAHSLWKARAGSPTAWRTERDRWSRETVYIIGGGPSAGRHNLKKLDGIVVAVNDSGRMLPDADVTFTADLCWVDRRLRFIEEFRGDVVVAMPTWSPRNLPLIERVPARCHRVPRVRDYNSGEEALYWAAEMGARRIVLVGFDLDRPGHWHGGYTWTHRPEMSPAVQYRKWLGTFADAAVDMKARGVEVLNANRRSAIRSFPFTTLKVPRKRKRPT